MSNTKNGPLAQEHRLRLCQILTDLSDHQLCIFLHTFVPNSSANSAWRYATTAQLFHLAVDLIDTRYSKEMEQVLQTIKQQQQVTSDYNQQPQRVSAAPVNGTPMYLALLIDDVIT